ncbi:MFS transporter [Glaciimonas soli]|uniref:MFS transporter n=1 Tax=Glaciimonas soli TaxID=2590999 RepID=A0A843Z0K8_9BURK|nr:MFS transporter [Glaciimonas soli]MQR02376.1 MFS transporter [Glaciimonas soli]
MTTPSTKISRTKLVGFVALAGPVTAATAPIASYLPAFYSEHLGLSLASVGFLFFSMRALDFFFDVLAGVLIDRRPFAGGKYRPWLVLGLLALLVGVWLLYMPPRQWVSVPLAFLGGGLLYLGFSFVSIAHQAWSSALSRSSDERVAIFGYREIAVIFGILAIFLTPAVAEHVYHADFETKVHVIGYALLIGIAITGVISLWAVRGKDEQNLPGQQHEAAHSHRVTLAGVGRVLRDPTVIKIVILFMLAFFALVGTASMMSFLVSGVFGKPNLVAQMQGVYFIAAMASIFLWLRMGKRFGEWGTLRVSTLTAIAAQLSVLLPLYFGSTWMLFLHFALLGAHFGAAPFLLRSLLGRIGQYKANEQGTDLQGILFSTGVFAEKIGSSIAVLFAFLMLGWLGFKPANATDPATHGALLGVYLALPIGAYALMSLIFMMRRSQSELAETRSARNALA